MDYSKTAGSVKMFTGGPLETNSYLIAAPEGNILIDASQGAAEAFREVPIALLFLTHGHYDHVWDAAEIVRQHGCPAAMHPVTEEMLADRNLLRRFGIDLEVEPVKADILLGEGPEQSLLGCRFDIHEVPGHCPGSLCLFDPATHILYGGDVLFAGGVGRWDLPGGDRDLLLSGIKKKLLTLPPETIVCPGHGPATNIGLEKSTNPYLQEE
jgi:hydroxyacylglutathione hydrolase